jgi:PEP-CTERM motif
MEQITMRRALAALSLGLVLLSCSARAATLTGLVLGIGNGTWWATTSQGVPSAIAPGNVNNPFVNPTDPFSISIGLNLGVNRFFVFAPDAFSYSPSSIFTLNLYIDATNSTPEISALAGVSGSLAGPYVPFSAFSGPSKGFENDAFTLGTHNGSGSLSFLSGGSLVTLTQFAIVQDTGIDRTGSSPNPNGNIDQIALVELTLTPGQSIPEPSTWMLGAAGVVMFGWRVRRGSQSVPGQASHQPINSTASPRSFTR